MISGLVVLDGRRSATHLFLALHIPKLHVSYKTFTVTPHVTINLLTLDNNAWKLAVLVQIIYDY